MVTSTTNPPIKVTGLGWTTALGNELQSVWQRVLAGETGLTEIPCDHRLRNNLAAGVSSVPLGLSPSERLHRMACDTALRAIKDAGFSPTEPRLFLIVGTSLGSHLEDQATGSLHRWAAKITDELGMVNSPISLSTACSSGADAILLGAELIRAGVASVCVCGGVDILTPIKRWSHSALGTMSPTLLRAFDNRHDGTLLGEGAGFLVLESTKGAEASSPAYAYLRGVGSANDAATMTSPDLSARGAQLAIQRALSDAGLTTTDSFLINAHGSGTPLNDMVERNAFKSIFQNIESTLVFATKGTFGHSLGATGAIEAIALILALRDRKAPPIFGLEQPDPEFPFPLPIREAMHCGARIGLSLTLGFGGFDTCLVFEVD